LDAKSPHHRVAMRSANQQSNIVHPFAKWAQPDNKTNSLLVKLT